MLSYLADLEQWWGPLRVFRYLSFRTLGGVVTAFTIGIVLGPWVIAKLRALKLRQTQRDASLMGALAAHNQGKKDTPTMGGWLIYIAVMASVLLWATPNIWVLTALLVYTWLTLVGFADDWLKVSRRNTRGLPGRWKIFWQTALVVAVGALLLLHPDSTREVRELWLPFVKNPAWAVMPAPAVFVLLWFVIVGFSNAINLTDGLDGLAIGCTVSVALVYGIMAYLAGNAIASRYLLISHVPGTGELGVICGALVGAGLAFLWYNAHPAEVFMGDTGSLALGGLVGIISFLIHQPFTLVIVGGIFVLEAASVVLQVASFKTTGRRIFRMAPIHHHFQLAGWPETKVVIRFWILALVLALAGLGTLKIR